MRTGKQKGLKHAVAISLMLGFMIIPKIADASSYSTTANLNLRTGPSTNYGSILTIPKNSNIEYLGSNGSWYNVSYSGKQGYVSNQYVSKLENLSDEYSTTSNLNLRTDASTSSRVLLTIPKGKSVSLISKHGSWYKVRYGNSQGYVSSQYLSSESSIPSIPTPTPPTSNARYRTITNLNLRSGASTRSKILLTIPNDTNVTLISKDGLWYKIKYGSEPGYVSSKYLTPSTSQPHTGSIDRPSASASRNKLADTALSLDNKVTYFWGGKTSKIGWDSNWGQPRKVTSPGDSTSGKILPFGLDCSGFIDWSFRTAGLGNSFSTGGTAKQWEATYAINESSLLVGDLAFKQTPWASGTNHIGIYVGNNNKGEKLFVNCSFTEDGVVVTTARDAKLSIYRRPNVFK